jgi:hypothetical protein
MTWRARLHGWWGSPPALEAGEIAAVEVDKLANGDRNLAGAIDTTLVDCGYVYDERRDVWAR